jgi:hypothetical protein
VKEGSSVEPPAAPSTDEVTKTTENVEKLSIAVDNAASVNAGPGTASSAVSTSADALDGLIDQPPSASSTNSKARRNNNNKDKKRHDQVKPAASQEESSQPETTPKEKKHNGKREGGDHHEKKFNKDNKGKKDPKKKDGNGKPSAAEETPKVSKHFLKYKNVQRENESIVVM